MANQKTNYLKKISHLNSIKGCELLMQKKIDAFFFEQLTDN